MEIACCMVDGKCKLVVRHCFERLLVLIRDYPCACWSGVVTRRGTSPPALGAHLQPRAGRSCFPISILTGWPGVSGFVERTEQIVAKK